MPIITMQGPAIPDLDKKRHLVRTMTAAAAAAYGLSTDTIIIVLREDTPDNVSVGGQLIIDRE